MTYERSPILSYPASLDHESCVRHGVVGVARSARARRSCRVVEKRVRRFTEPARAPAATFSGQSQIGDFSDDGRRTEPDGNVRSEARVEQAGGSENAGQLREDSRAVYRCHQRTVARLQARV